MTAAEGARPRCGFIGLGAMGAPMARHLHRGGLLAVVGNRGVEKAHALATELGVIAATRWEDFRDCDLVALCVPGDADVRQNVEGLAGVLAEGSVVVDHSTVSIRTAVDCASTLAAHRIGFLDAPVSGGVEGARNGCLSVMAGGDVAGLARARVMLECYAARIAHLGAKGSGQAAKAVNQVLVAGINEAVCEGLALAEALGLDAETLLPTLSAGAAGNWFLDRRGASMLRGEFQPGFKCAHLLKDLEIVAAVAAAAEVRLPIVDAARNDYRALVEAGHGDDDTSVLITLKRQGRLRGPSTG